MSSSEGGTQPLDPGRELAVLQRPVLGEGLVGLGHGLLLREHEHADVAEDLAHVAEGPEAPQRSGGGGEDRRHRQDALAADPGYWQAAHNLGLLLDQLGDPEDWLTEWKWDGIRAQLVRRAGKCFLWSRGEDLVTDRFPEVGEAASWLPDGTVLDGELLPWNDEGVMGFADLQKRLGRKRIPADLLNEVPVRFMAYDILENRGRDRGTYVEGSVENVLEAVPVPSRHDHRLAAAYPERLVPDPDIRLARDDREHFLDRMLVCRRAKPRLAVLLEDAKLRCLGHRRNEHDRADTLAPILRRLRSVIDDLHHRDLLLTA